jgi:hypothetical protein
MRWRLCRLPGAADQAGIGCRERLGRGMDADLDAKRDDARPTRDRAGGEHRPLLEFGRQPSHQLAVLVQHVGDRHVPVDRSDVGQPRTWLTGERRQEADHRLVLG